MAIFSNIQKRMLTQSEKENGSKFFQKKIPSIVAGGQFLIDFHEQDLAYWIPFDFMQIINNDAVDFEILINQQNNNLIFSASGTNLSLDDTAISSIIIKNNSNTTASIENKLILNFRKKGMDATTLIKKFNRWF